jgi:ADP-dependent NAD(P)H-hydrate dehydratase / NAD(P)H-hydrate epimerase
MKPALTSEQVARLEAGAVQRGTSIAQLMEDAGSALAAEAVEWAAPAGRFVALCGQGNNGGDGLVAARKLAQARRSVAVQVIGGPERLKGEPLRNLELLRAAGASAAAVLQVAPGPGDAVIDALFGTGLNRAPQGEYAEAIERISRWRKAGAKVISADLPSGLHTDTGRAFTPCVEADATVSFGQLKLGQVLEPGASLCGKLKAVDIGLPDPSEERIGAPVAYLLEESDARERVPIRAADSHKGTYGHALFVAGSWGKTGAAALAGLGALRAGAGLASIVTRSEAIVAAMSHAPELMGIALGGQGPLVLADLDALLGAAEGKRSVVIGPGIPVGGETSALLNALLGRIDLPCVLDADGLNAVQGELDVLRQAKARLILTPHPGEMARLLRRSTAEVQADRVAAVRALAAGANAVAVLKGARTLIGLPDGTVYVNPTGNPGMATAGTGDVLSGICGGLLAQGLAPADAAICGVFAHGLAGDLVSVRTGRAGLIASDLLAGLQEVWVRWRR